jgi:hypothetical protein
LLDLALRLNPMLRRTLCHHFHGELEARLCVGMKLKFLHGGDFPMLDQTFRILIDVRGKDEHQIEPDLEEHELAAIGYVSAQWAFLEHAILASTIKIAEDNQAPIPTDAYSLAFAKRLRAWRLMIEEYVAEPAKGVLLKIASSAANLEEKRHQAAHALWTWEDHDPQTMRAFSFRPNVEFDVDFDFEGLRLIGEKIGRLNFQLIFPGGKEDAWKSFIDLASEKSAYVSRSFLLSAAKKAPSNRRPRQGSLPKRKPPRSPSRQ